MRYLVIGALALTAALGAAVMANAQQPEIRWERVPTGRDLERHYPVRAVQRSQSGAAVLCCHPNADGSLRCSVATESPSGFGFGWAALQLALEFRMAEADVATWTASGKAIRVAMPFRIVPGVGSAERALEGTEAICEAPQP